MDFTTTTKIARNGRKEFDCDYKIVFCNDEDVGMILGKKMYHALYDSGLLTQIREELREANDPETVKLITDYRAGIGHEDSISLEEFRKEYDV